MKLTPIHHQWPSTHGKLSKTDMG